MNVFVTSDEHYGHGGNDGKGGILKLAKRPFSHIKEHNEFLIEQHNKTVPNKPNQLTIHAGDLFWRTMPLKEAVSIFYRLNGQHAFLFGNHDELIEQHKFLRGLFVFVKGQNKAGGSYFLRHNDHDLTVSHFARRVWQGSYRGHWHVYGHSHSSLPGIGKSFDIGVDGHNFAPWHIDEIAAKMETLQQHHSVAGSHERS
jgi:calcineurin-like phosphoesterase family protein